MDIGKDLQRAYDDGYEQGKRDAVRWIPVTEQLPEAHEAVVVFHPKYSNSHIAAYYRELETQPEVHCVNKWYVYGGFGVVLNPEPTHWMPIPEPPKEET